MRRPAARAAASRASPEAWRPSPRGAAVIHAGLYYAPGSLKASLCVAGAAALYDFCAARGVAHARLGKLVVASSAAQLPALEALAERAAACGAPGVRRLTAAQSAALEPAVAAAGALLSPHSGIVDSHCLMAALQADAEGAAR